MTEDSERDETMSATLTDGRLERAEIIEDCAEEIMVLAQSLLSSANSSFNDGDQGSAIINRFRGEGIKLAADLLHRQADELRASVKAQANRP